MINKNISDIRCKKCNKLIVKLSAPNLYEIKCNRCGTLNVIFEELSEQVIITDCLGRIVYMNRSVEMVTGYSISESIGKKPSELWGGEMDDYFYKEMWDKILNEKKSVNFKIKNRHKNGELYDVELTVSPIIDNSGQIVYFVGMEIDKKKKVR